MSERPHGYARYKLDDCRCYICGFAASVYREARNAAIAAGTWQPWVDAAPVREHIRRLQDCSMGLRTIATAAGCGRPRLQHLLNGRPHRGTGRQEKLRPALAAAILRVEPTLENLAPSALVGSTGSIRRLHALVAVGWPQQRIAAALGMTPTNFRSMLSFPHVTARRALEIRTVYDRLWNADPLKHGATPAGVTRARRMARDRGWAPVGAWDDETIDDPAAHPDWTGRCGTPQGYWAHLNNRLGPPCPRCCAAYNAERPARKGAAA